MAAGQHAIAASAPAAMPVTVAADEEEMEEAVGV